jgi:signal transduction histidine kinase
VRSIASRVIAASVLLAVIFIAAAVVAVEDQRAVAAAVGTMVTVVLLAAGLAAYLIRSVVLRSNELESRNAIDAAVIDAVRDGIVLRDLEGRVVVANRTMDTFPREFLGDSVRNAGAQEDPDEDTDDEFEHAASGRFFQRLTAPVRDGQGRRIGRLTVIREVTAERKAERAKNRLMATVSHDLRTPLTAILGFTEILMTRASDDDVDKTSLEMMHSEAKRLSSLIGQFVDLQTVERGSRPLESARQSTRDGIAASAFSALIRPS